jgi:hypothetical protein
MIFFCWLRLALSPLPRSWIIMLTMYCCCRRTVVDVKLLQLWDSMRLCNPTISLSGFLKAIADAAATLHPTQV